MGIKDSYAKQASLIVNKYKIRLGKDLDKDDTLARQGLELEMNRLKEKQEATKVSMVGNKKKYGGKVLPKYKWPNDDNDFSMQLDNNENFYFNEDALVSDSNSKVIPNLKNEDIYSSLAANIKSRNKYSITDVDKNIKNEYLGGDSAVTGVNNKSNNNTDKLYEPTLSVVPLAASLLGNALLLGDNEAENIKYDRVKPELISLAREREAARKRADFSRNASKRTARGLGLSGGAAATVANAADVDIDRGLGEQIGKSYLNEELSNKEAINRSKMMNAEISMREKDANLREKDSVASTKQQAIQNIIGNIGKYYSDTQSANEMNALTQAMSQDYNYYEKPGQSILMKYLTGNSQNRYRKVNKDYIPPTNG